MVSAKTTITASFRTHNISISDKKAMELVDLASYEFMDDITRLMSEELIDLIIDELNDLIDDDLVDLLSGDVGNDGTPDLLEELIVLINDAFVDLANSPDDILEYSIVSDYLENFESDDAIMQLLSNIGFSLLGPSLEKIFVPAINMTLKQMFTSPTGFPLLISTYLPMLADPLIDDIPEVLKDILAEYLPGLYAEAVRDEVPYLIENLAFRYLPRNLKMHVAALDVKTDLNDFFAIGGGVKAISLAGLFLPEVSVSTYLKIVNNPTFNCGFMASGQLMFLPFIKNFATNMTSDDILAVNAGFFFSWQVSPSFNFEGELMVGTIVAAPFGLKDTIPLVGGYTLGLNYNITDHIHVKASFDLNGFSNLAVTALEYFLTDRLNIGHFTLSVGCHF